MSTWKYAGPQEETVPDMGAQDDIGGTLILRPGQEYEFEGSPQGNLAWWTCEAPPADKDTTGTTSPVTTDTDTTD